MAHTHHPQIREQGLADGCLDCAAYADDPWFMDTENFANLVHVAKQGLWGYPKSWSDNQIKAYENVRTLLNRVTAMEVALQNHPKPTVDLAADGVVTVASWEDFEDDPMEPRFEAAD